MQQGYHQTHSCNNIQLQLFLPLMKIPNIQVKLFAFICLLWSVGALWINQRYIEYDFYYPLDYVGLPFQICGNLGIVYTQYNERNEGGMHVQGRYEQFFLQYTYISQLSCSQYAKQETYVSAILNNTKTNKVENVLLWHIDKDEIIKIPFDIASLKENVTKITQVKTTGNILAILYNKTETINNTVKNQSTIQLYQLSKLENQAFVAQSLTTITVPQNKCNIHLSSQLDLALFCLSSSQFILYYGDRFQYSESAYLPEIKYLLDTSYERNLIQVDGFTYITSIFYYRYADQSYYNYGKNRTQVRVTYPENQDRTLQVIGTEGQIGTIACGNRRFTYSLGSTCISEQNVFNFIPCAVQAQQPIRQVFCRLSPSIIQMSDDQVVFYVQSSNYDKTTQYIDIYKETYVWTWIGISLLLFYLFIGIVVLCSVEIDQFHHLYTQIEK